MSSNMVIAAVTAAIAVLGITMYIIIRRYRRRKLHERVIAILYDRHFQQNFYKK